MENDNIRNFLIEREESRQRTRVLKKTQVHEAVEGYSHASRITARYSGGRRSVRGVSEPQSSTSTGAYVPYNLRGASKIATRSGDTSSTNFQHKKSSIQMQSKRHFINGATVSVENDSEGEGEMSRYNAQAANKSLHTSDYSSDEGRERENDTLKGSAYPIYKKAGDWWNVFPKTDYTYSPVSPNRKEIVPGVIPMPNMSRRGIHTGHTRFDSAQTSNFINSHIESHTRQSIPAMYRPRTTYDDSDYEEVDVQPALKLVNRNFITRIFTSLWIAVTYLYSSSVGLLSRPFRHSAIESRRITGVSHNSSWFQKIKIWHYVSTCYTWLTKAISSRIYRRNYIINNWSHVRTSRCSRYLCLLLIPPLILLGWLFHLHGAKLFMDPSESLTNMYHDWVPSLWWTVYPVATTVAPVIKQSVEDPSLMDKARMVPAQGSDQNLEAVVWDIISSEHFQNLLLKEREWMLRESSFTTLELQTLKKEIQEKNNLLNKQLELSTRLAAEVDRLREEIGRLRTEIQTRDGGIDSSHMIWRRRMKRLEDKITLLQASHTHRPCCQPPPSRLPTAAIQEYVEKFLSGSFHSNGESEMRSDTETWTSLFVTKDEFKFQLANITSSINDVQEASRQSAQTMTKFSEGLLKQQADLDLYLLSEHRSWPSPASTPLRDDCNFTRSQVEEIVNSALNRYDADKTGMVDYALESSGGSVLNTRCTENFNARAPEVSLLGFSIWWSNNNPRSVIQPGVIPGECWAFRGVEGYLVISLSKRIKISGFSMEHIPVSLSPSGNIDSAPKDFSVWGLEKEFDVGVLLGRYRYEQNSTSLQFFGVMTKDVQPFQIVELKIESNHGNMEYTCLYRFRVHGVLSPQ